MVTFFRAMLDTNLKWKQTPTKESPGSILNTEQSGPSEKDDDKTMKFHDMMMMDHDMRGKQQFRGCLYHQAIFWVSPLSLFSRNLDTRETF